MNCFARPLAIRVEYSLDSRWKPIFDFVAAAMGRARFSPYNARTVKRAEFIAALGERYVASSDFPDTSHVDSSEYEDLHAQISAPLDGGWTVSAESSR